VDWIAAAIVLVCLVILVVDASRRWGRPSACIDARSPVTWAVAAVLVSVVVAVNIID
jgi:hypothetical protein